MRVQMKTLENHSTRDKFRKIITVLVIVLTIIFINKLAYGEANNSDNSNTSVYNISFISEPNNASIFINGDYKGKTPNNFSLPLDSYRLEIIYPNYEAFSEDYIAKKDDILKINLNKLYFTSDLIYILSIGIILIGFLYLYYRYKINESENKLLLINTPKRELVDNIGFNKNDNEKLVLENNKLKNDNKEFNNKLKFTEQQLESKKLDIKQLQDKIDYISDGKIKTEMKLKETEMKLKETESNLKKYDKIFDLKNLPIEEQNPADLKQLYEKFIEEKRVLKEVYALEEVLSPIFYAMKDAYNNTDIKVMRNLPVYSPIQVFKLLKDIEIKLEKNPEFMQCLKAIKRRL